MKKRICVCFIILCCCLNLVACAPDDYKDIPIQHYLTEFRIKCGETWDSVKENFNRMKVDLEIYFNDRFGSNNDD